MFPSAQGHKGTKIVSTLSQCIFSFFSWTWKVKFRHWCRRRSAPRGFSHRKHWVMYKRCCVCQISGHTPVKCRCYCPIFFSHPRDGEYLPSIRGTGGVGEILCLQALYFQEWQSTFPSLTPEVEKLLFWERIPFELVGWSWSFPTFPAPLKAWKGTKVARECVMVEVFAEVHRLLRNTEEPKLMRSSKYSIAFLR